MKFAWVHTEIQNRSILNMVRNVTEYVTVELLTKNFEVVYCNTVAEARDSDMYATIGTLFDDKLYKEPVQDVDNSNYVILSHTNLYDKIGFVNTMLNPYKHFVGNTENLFDTCKDNGKVYDVCVCSAGGVTPLKVHNHIRLTDDATIIVVDYSKVALDMSTKIVGDWDMSENLNIFINRNKLIDDPYVYLGEYHSDGEPLIKHSNYKFIYVDLFDVDSIRTCLESIQGKNGLWLASNIFNYITTSLLYDVDLRHSKQQDFLRLLSNHSTEWDVGLVTSGSGLYLDSAKVLKDIVLFNKLQVLPWR